MTYKKNLISISVNVYFIKKFSTYTQFLDKTDIILR